MAIAIFLPGGFVAGAAQAADPKTIAVVDAGLARARRISLSPTTQAGQSTPPTFECISHMVL